MSEKISQYRTLLKTSQTVNHEQTTELFMSLARKHNVTTTNFDYAKTSGSLAVCRALDTLVDEDKVRDESTIQHYLSQTIQGVSSEYIPKEVAQDFSKVYRELSNSEKGIVLMAPALVLFAESYKNIHDPAGYCHERTNESALFAKVMQLSQTISNDATARAKHNEWLYAFSSAGYAVDTFIDLKKDYNEENTSIEPSIAAYAIIGSYALKETYRCYKGENIDLIPTTIVAGIAKILRAIRNT